MELTTDPFIINAYNKLVNKTILREDTNKFIGGLPITLERENMLTLIHQDYSVTQKVDGARYLMYCGPNTLPATSSDKSRVITFIDRNNKFYKLLGQTSSGGLIKIEYLPDYKNSELLIDGELIYFDENGNPHPLDSTVDYGKIKGVSFMAFDILYGPKFIDLSSTERYRELIVGEAVPMAGPQGRDHGHRVWTYRARYDILSKLIIPNELNQISVTDELTGENYRPLLTLAFVDINWFNIELKPLYIVNRLDEYGKPLYVTTNKRTSGILVTDLNEYRTIFYNKIHKLYGKSIYKFIKTIKLDGLIFTPFNTEYITGAWNELYNTQFKWKPHEEQSIDFLINKTTNRQEDYIIVGLLVSAGKNRVVAFNNYGNPYLGLVPLSEMGNIKPIIYKKNGEFQSGTIGEFVFVKGTFIFKGIRKDKLYPNAGRVAANVMKSILYPVNINDLLLFLNIKTANKIELKIILNYIPKSALIKCLKDNGKILLFTKEKESEIMVLFDKFSKTQDTELEFRLGYLKDSFDSNIREQGYKGAINIMQQLGWQSYTSDFIDIFSEDVRSRYLFSTIFNKYLIFSNIKKEKITDVNVSLNKIYNIDLRLSLSSELPESTVVSSGNTFRKTRISFISANNLFEVDITKIQKGKFTNQKFEGDGKMTYQIEFEVKNKTVSFDTILNFLYYFLGKFS